MAERTHLAWFRERLAASARFEPCDIASILEWRDARSAAVQFSSTLIPLKEVRDWHSDKNGNIFHKSGQFFSLEGVRTESGGAREVRSWDQPIINQIDGGVLMMVVREVPEDGVQFLLQAYAAPGNLGPIQLAPSLQSTWSNIRRAHQGNSPPLTELLSAERGVRIVYRAFHNEEGGRFWRKSNENVVLFLDDHDLVAVSDAYRWASLTQIKELGLVDNVLSPYVKTIVASL